MPSIISTFPLMDPASILRGFGQEATVRGGACPGRRPGVDTYRTWFLNRSTLAASWAASTLLLWLEPRHCRRSAARYFGRRNAPIMPSQPTHHGYVPAWQPAWGQKRMEYLYYLLDPEEAKLKALARDLEPSGFVVKELQPYLGDRAFVLYLAKEALLSEAEYEAEVQHVLALCDRHAIAGLDELRVNERNAVDFWLN